MSELLARVLSKQFGAKPPSTIDGEISQESQPNPMMASILKGMGIDLPSILASAESIKGAVEAKLNSIDDKLERILSSQLTIEMKLSELESNQGVMLRHFDEYNHEDQFQQMAEHPLTTELQESTLQQELNDSISAQDKGEPIESAFVDSIGV